MFTASAIRNLKSLEFEVFARNTQAKLISVNGLGMTYLYHRGDFVDVVLSIDLLNDKATDAHVARTSVSSLESLESVRRIAQQANSIHTSIHEFKGLCF